MFSRIRTSSIVVGGALGAAEVDGLLEHCRGLRNSGVARLRLDMGDVTDVHPAGLDGLCALEDGMFGLDVAVEGAHWRQFLILLSVTPLSDLRSVRDSVRRLIGGPPPARSVRVRRGRTVGPRPDPAAPAGSSGVTG